MKKLILKPTKPKQSDQSSSSSAKKKLILKKKENDNKEDKKKSSGGASSSKKKKAKEVKKSPCEKCKWNCEKGKNELLLGSYSNICFFVNYDLPGHFYVKYKNRDGTYTECRNTLAISYIHALIKALETYNSQRKKIEKIMKRRADERAKAGEEE